MDLKKKLEPLWFGSLVLVLGWVFLWAMASPVREGVRPEAVGAALGRPSAYDDPRSFDRRRVYGR